MWNGDYVIEEWMAGRGSRSGWMEGVGGLATQGKCSERRQKGRQKKVGGGRCCRARVGRRMGGRVGWMWVGDEPTGGRQSRPGGGDVKVQKDV